MKDLGKAEFTEAADPFALFKLWLQEARAAEINDPEAMTLATVDAQGFPDARMVLCKGADARGLVFYTNIESAKGHELACQPRAAALFHWKSLRRQARFRGAVSEVTAVESDAYFASRPRGSQSAPGRASNRGRLPRAPISKRRLRLTNDDSEAASRLGPTIGAAIASNRWRSSSGAIAPPGCMSAFSSGAQHRNPTGQSGFFILKLRAIPPRIRERDLPKLPPPGR